MYAKGLHGLHNVGATLEALRQSARKEARLSRDELRRLMIREDVCRQNEHLREQQRLLHNCNQGNPTFSGMADLFGNTPMSSEARAVSSTSVCCGGEARDVALPPWYDGYYDPQVNATNNDDSKDQCRTEDGVVSDLVQRVSHATLTLYPTLLAAVEVCAPLEFVEQDESQAEGRLCSSAVVEWDDHGTPAILRSTRPATASGCKRNGLAAHTASVNCVRPVLSDSLCHGASPHSQDDIESRDQKRSQSPSSLTGGVHHQSGYRLKMASLNPSAVTSDGCDKRRLCSLSSSHSSAGHSSHARRLTGRQKLCREGTAVAESSASAIVKQISHAALKCNAQRRYVSGNNGAQLSDGAKCATGNEARSNGRYLVEYEPNCEKETLYAHVVRPLVAVFCVSCGSCAARDMATGLPSTCQVCGEPLGQLPAFATRDRQTDESLTPPKTDGSTLSSVAASGQKETRTSKDVVCFRACSSANSSITGAKAAAETRTTGVGTWTGGADAVKDVTTGMRHGLDWCLKPLPTTARGLYFLHLWDQASPPC
ncbi:hypothetical protein ERJ75_000348300 [Trypanosoma vivax]|uniref:Uncharacterized protein n=1 Tax=Trypanosoma vivax (strain Y486) TaxID=1055687 RepID=G0TVF0_TRYVY|nr:hypothetical protein TRVL_00865 [Trypanosoma vivax]KAH8617608.1 hypothetical protein ERJ75_000348300 [Trypanosoma vivax]CCC47916.1 conserved hypothetical protein [Trypanosoma vivax Y486]